MFRRTSIHLLYLCLFFILLPVAAQSQIITTVVAGTSINDNGPATQAALGGLTKITLDRTGNLYIADLGEYRIRKVDRNGIITTIAGNGTFGMSGDGGLATQAQIGFPTGMAFDTSGNFYFADRQYGRVRKIDTNGIISTIAGYGQFGNTGDGGPAIRASVDWPQDILVTQDGTLYILANQQVRKVDTRGVITTIAGSGYGYSGDNGPALYAQFSSPGGLAIDKQGNLYIADTYNRRIRKIDTNGIITTYAGNGTLGSDGDGGSATQARLYNPTDIAFDSTGALYITQSFVQSKIRKVSPNGIITTIAGVGNEDFSGDGGPATLATLSSPSDVAIDSTGNLYVADSGNKRARRIHSSGIISTIAGGGNGDGGSALQAYIGRFSGMANPSNVNVDEIGNLYVTDRARSQIRKITPNGIISTFAGTGAEGYAGDNGHATRAKLYYPRGVAFDKDKNVYIVDQYNRYLRKVDTSGIINTVAGSGFGDFIDPGYSSSYVIYSLSILPKDLVGNMYAFSQCCVIRITPDGYVESIAGTPHITGFSGDGGPASQARLNNPSSAVYDPVDQSLYISDDSNYRIRKIAASGIITTVAGNGQASNGYNDENVLAINAAVQPRAIAMDADRNLYFSETWGVSRIRKLDRNGILTTVAGSYLQGYSGDNGPATQALLNAPYQIEFDAAGNMYIADTGNRRIRKITYPIRPTIIASSTLSCPSTSVTLTATPTGPGFRYQFGRGATQIGTTNQAVALSAGMYSVTVSTPVFGSPAGTTSVLIASAEIQTVRAGLWNDPGVWSCGQVPNASQPVRILHRIDIPANYQAAAQSVQYRSGGKVTLGTNALLRLNKPN
jgi:trimeric autotransporter adhesin